MLGMLYKFIELLNDRKTNYIYMAEEKIEAEAKAAKEV